VAVLSLWHNNPTTTKTIFITHNIMYIIYIYTHIEMSIYYVDTMHISADDDRVVSGVDEDERYNCYSVGFNFALTCARAVNEKQVELLLLLLLLLSSPYMRRGGDRRVSDCVCRQNVVAIAPTG